MSRSRPLASRFCAFALVVLTAGCASGPAEVSAEDQAVIDGADIGLVGTDDLTWEPDEVSADAGEVTFAITCEQSVNHNLAIEGEEVAACAPGQTVSDTIELDAGTYEFVCTIPGHERRMRGTLTVS
jgi:plastocyanin